MDEFEHLTIANCDKKPPASTHQGAIDPATTIITSLSSDDDDEAMSDEDFTHQEKAARDVMYKLALGSSAPPKDSVDAKLEDMIRKTRLQLAVANQTPRDDFDLETPYTHASVLKNTMNSSRTRQRSNSLPRDWEGPSQPKADAERMDVDMTL